MDTDNLKAFIVNLPSNLGYNKPLAVRQNLFKALYYSATKEGEYLPKLFPNIKQEEIESLKDLRFPISEINERRPFFNCKSNKSAYTHPSNKACTRPFKKGEPVYRCEQCGYDDTCVLCVHCFNKDDHIDHNVYMYLSQGDNGGICDCGDPEAFVRSLNCKCQVSSSIQYEFDAIKPYLQATIRTCLDYILDVTNFSVQTLPFIHSNINNGRGDFTSENLSNYSSLSSANYGGAKDSNSEDLWFLIMWNDEHHDIEQATRAIIASIGVSRLKAKELTNEINLRGNCILSESSNYKDLLKAQTSAQVDGLVATIVSARDYMREVIVRYMFNWLHDIIEFSGNSEFRDLSKSYLGSILLEPGFKFDKAFPEEFIQNLSINHRRRCFENGLVCGGEFVNMALSTVHEDSKVEDLMKSTHILLDVNPKYERLQNSRLQFLLAFEIRFPSTIRKKLSALLVPPIVEDANKKDIFSKQFISIYPHLITILALCDREELLNTLPEITTQIFTCPRSVSEILDNNQAGLVLGPVTQIIEEHSARWNYDSGYPNLVEIADGSPHTYKSIKKAILRGIHDIVYLVDRKLETNMLHEFLSKDNLIMVLLFLRNFQGYWPLERKYGDHVEREILDFVIHLEYSTPILNIAKLIASCEVSNRSLAKDAVRIIIEFLNLRKIKKNAPGIAEFRVSKEPVSFVNPINSLLSFLLVYQGFDVCESILLDLKMPFMNISDVSLRSIVLAAQVKIGFWIRNGISVSRQATLYTDSLLNDLQYYRDFHLNQIACILDEPRATLYNFLDRWELLPWYSNEVSYDKTVYEDRFSSISENFIVFLYNLIVDRSNFFDMKFKERATYKAKQSISYALSDEPKSYLTLKRVIDIDVCELAEFDELLEECADYRPPTGLLDSGMYILKSTLIDMLDPLNLRLNSIQSQAVIDSKVKKISRDKKIKEDEVVLVPKIVISNNSLVDQKIAKFTKTKDFAKLIYKFLQTSIDNLDETYLFQLLHLLHAVLIDDEFLYGPNYLCENFVNIPICDLLLTIVESSMSKQIVNKADYLVDQFISKDKIIVENLTNCFGEEYMKSYKKRKTGLFESESDIRKRVSEERKAKVMKKFARQREKFLANNQEFAVKDSASNTDNKEIIELRTCVMCGEKESIAEPFGILASKTKASIFWKIPEDCNEYAAIAFKDFDAQENPKDESIYGYGFNYYHTKSSSDQSVEAPVITTCGHGMHLSCYKRSGNGLKYFACPLCHNLHDLFIPSFIPPSNGGGLDDDELSREPINSKYNQMTTAICDHKSQTLSLGFMNEEYSTINDEDVKKLILPVFEIFLPQIVSNNSSLPNRNYFNYLEHLSVVVADTIRMTEITTRLGGSESLAGFVSEIPSSSKSLIKSLIQCIALVFNHSKKMSLLDSDLKMQVEKFWDSSKVLESTFNEVLLLYFQTDESFLTLARFGYIKLFTIAVYSLLERCSRNIGYIYCLSKESAEVETCVLEKFISVIDFFKEHINLSNLPLQNPDFIRSLFFSVERITLPYLRQIIILGDILMSQDFGDNTHVSVKKFESLSREIENQVRLDSTLALTNLLGLPSLNSIIEGLVGEKSELFNFEFNIFDIVLNAKIQRYIDHGILTLQYPGVVSLITLPKDYNSCIIEQDDNHLKGAYDYIVCLHCGVKLKDSKLFTHMNSCMNQTNVFYHPRLNNLKICTYIGHSPFSIIIPAPYLTSHGEIKRARSSGKAELNEMRYNYLNKLWLNQGLYGFVTRSLFGARQQPQTDLNTFTFPMADEENEDDDEIDFIYEDDNGAFVW